MKISLLIPILLLAAAQAVYASFAISPQQALIFKVGKGERVGWVELTNNGRTPIAVELTAHKRILDLDGELADSMPKSDDFMIYPSQNLLYPGGRARAQVVLKGKESITADRAYILYAREVPFDFPSEEEGEVSLVAGVSVAIAYQIVIALETNKPGSLSFVSSKALDSGYVEVIVENKSFGRVAMGSFYIMAGDKKITEFICRENSIMPGQKRRLIFKHSKPLTAKEFRWGSL